MNLQESIEQVENAIGDLPFGKTQIVIAVTSSENESEMCVYVDNGIYCLQIRLSDVDFSREELLKSIDFDGLKLAFADKEFDNHPKWCTPRWMIYMINGTFPKSHWEEEDEETKKLIKWLRSQLL